jgi:hypothetical protein
LKSWEQSVGVEICRSRSRVSAPSGGCGGCRGAVMTTPGAL